MTSFEQLKEAAHAKAALVAEIANHHGIPADVALMIVNQEAAQVAAAPKPYGLS